jgi:hypothetical protein
MPNLDAFTTAYLECALWSSTDDAGEPLDCDYSISDIAPESLTSMIEDCADFQASYRDLYRADWTSEQAGHDFWLTRNHHGAGFWDRGFSAGKQLTDAAHAYGSCDIYIGDDGKVYAE